MWALFLWKLLACGMWDHPSSIYAGWDGEREQARERETEKREGHKVGRYQRMT
jgi:hypothetical protein